MSNRSAKRPSDPVVVWRWRGRALAMMALVALAGAAAWALRPLPSSSFVTLPPNSAGTARSESGSPPRTVDPSLFRVQLYNPVPAPATAGQARAAEPAPVRLQLVGIISDPGHEPSRPAVLRAALYDADTDRLYIVAAGERIGKGGHSVGSVAAGRVEIHGADGRRRTLELDPGTAGRAAGAAFPALKARAGGTSPPVTGGHP